LEVYFQVDRVYAPPDCPKSSVHDGDLIFLKGTLISVNNGDIPLEQKHHRLFIFGRGGKKVMTVGDKKARTDSEKEMEKNIHHLAKSMCVGEKVNVITPFKGNKKAKLDHITTVTYQIELEDVFKPPLGHKPSLTDVEDPCTLKDLSLEKPNILAYIMRQEDLKSDRTAFGRDKVTERLIFEYVATNFNDRKDMHFVEIQEITPKCLKALDLGEEGTDSFPLVKLFKDGHTFDYDFHLTKDKVIEFMETMSPPFCEELETKKDLETFKAKHPISVVLFHDAKAEKDKRYLKYYKQAALDLLLIHVHEHSDAAFGGKVEMACASGFGVRNEVGIGHQHPTIIGYFQNPKLYGFGTEKAYGGSYQLFLEHMMSREKMISNIRSHTSPLVFHFDEKRTANYIFTHPAKFQFIVIAKSDGVGSYNEMFKKLAKIAKDYRHDAVFFMLDNRDDKHDLYVKKLGVKPSDKLPLTMLVNKKTHKVLRMKDSVQWDVFTNRALSHKDESVGFCYDGPKWVNEPGPCFFYDPDTAHYEL
jgi:hypothetical protein